MIIGVIGAGTMGEGIAQTFAQHEQYEVIICSSRLETAQAAKKRLEARLAKRVSKGKLESKAAEAILNRITAGEKKDCGDCDIIIESVSEDLAIKNEVLSYMDTICKKDCIFATNTSSLSVTEIASRLPRQVVGMHFFNPVPVMKLVEVIPGLNTSEELVGYICGLAESIGKTPVVVKEHAGFVVNRVLIPMINEAIGLYADGVAEIKDIDTAMKLGANHPMGPLELGDLIGLDVCLAIMEVIRNETGDSKYRPHPLLRKMVRGGWLGRKSGKGFYTYN